MNSALVRLLVAVKVFLLRLSICHMHPLMLYHLLRVCARRNCWRGRLLSSAGQLTLIQSVLMAIPLYTFSAMEPPKRIIDLIQRRLSDFFWGSSDVQKCRKWIAWDHCTSSTDMNGLGIRSIPAILQAYSCKLCWKIDNGLGLWAQFIDSMPQGLSASHISRRLLSVQHLYDLHSGLIVQDGSSSFWMENWTGLGPLQSFVHGEVPFPDWSIARAFADPVTLHRVLSDILPTHVFSDVQQRSFSPVAAPDRRIWRLTVTGSFSLASAYELFAPKRRILPVMKVIWNKRLPKRVSVFMWRLLNGILPFPDVLMTIGFSMPSKCCFCAHVDDLQHFFGFCPFVQTVWEFFCIRLHLMPVVHSSL